MDHKLGNRLFNSLGSLAVLHRLLLQTLLYLERVLDCLQLFDFMVESGPKQLKSLLILLAKPRG